MLASRRSYSPPAAQVKPQLERVLNLPPDALTKDFAELMRPAYAITGHCSQGSTFNCKYAIYDWDRIPKDVRGSWRYVAVSRTTNKDHIYINNSKQLEHIQIGRIYKITNTTNNLVYIGSTMQSSVDKRFAEHVKNCEGGAKETLYGTTVLDEPLLQPKIVLEWVSSGAR